MTKTYQNAIGEEIRLNITDPITGLPLTTGATFTCYNVTNPDSSTTTWAAQIYDLNNLTYLTQAGDLSQIGNYEIQTYVEWGGIVKIPGETYTLRVYPPGG